MLLPPSKVIGKLFVPISVSAGNVRCIPSNHSHWFITVFGARVSIQLSCNWALYRYNFAAIWVALMQKPARLGADCRLIGSVNKAMKLSVQSWKLVNFQSRTTLSIINNELVILSDVSENSMLLKMRICRRQVENKCMIGI
jgi:hypothetical protein